VVSAELILLLKRVFVLVSFQQKLLLFLRSGSGVVYFLIKFRLYNQPDIFFKEYNLLADAQ
jgi:hypothetical protein